MNRLRRALHLGLAALIAAASGGLFLVPLFAGAAAVTALLDSGPLGMGSAAEAVPIALLTLILSGLAIVPAIALCWLPAFLAGAVLRSAGRSRRWARRRPAWAAAGALVAGIAWIRAFSPGTAQPPFDGSGPSMPALAAAFLLAGAGAGLVYRSALAATAPFFGLDEDESE